MEERILGRPQAVGDEQTQCGKASEVGSRWPNAGTWLFSTRHLAAKLIALVGVAFFIHGSVVTTSRYFRESAMNRAYTDVLEGIRSGNDRLIIDRAASYLEQVDPSTTDLRASQVVLFLREAVLRETVRLTTVGSEEDAAALLKKSDQITAHWPMAAEGRGEALREGGTP
jgi:hypothetical protein